MANIGLSVSVVVAPFDRYRPIKCEAYYEDSVREDETTTEAFHRIGKTAHEMLEANVALSVAKFLKIENGEGMNRWAKELLKTNNEFLDF